jgi:hypothetical protein
MMRGTETRAWRPRTGEHNGCCQYGAARTRDAIAIGAYLIRPFRPDGYEVLLGTVGTHAYNQTLVSPSTTRGMPATSVATLAR